MIFETKPEDFNKSMDIVACYVEHDGKFILLHRHAHKSSGDRWGLPAGKVDPGETRTQALQREIREETGISIPEEEFRYFNTFIVRHPTIDFEYHLFSVSLSEKPEVTINEKEHQAFVWVTPAESLKMNLVIDQGECTRRFYRL
jgi:8-oxo-dGTP diphosphatase